MSGVFRVRIVLFAAARISTRLMVLDWEAGSVFGTPLAPKHPSLVFVTRNKCLVVKAGIVAGSISVRVLRPVANDDTVTHWRGYLTLCINTRPECVW